MYAIKIIKEPEHLLDCQPFSIDNFSWGGSYRPVAWGYAGLLSEKGFLIRLESSEPDPLCTYTKTNDPVYKDSALEAFLQLNPDHSPAYINLELNANGTLLAMFGDKKDNRICFSEEQAALCPVTCYRGSEGWWVQLLLPFCVIEDFYGPVSFLPGTRVRCNFYKISESPAWEHYASYAPISHEVPNFHLPVFFADAVITD